MTAETTETTSTPGIEAFKRDVNNITARRWFGIRRALDMTSDEVLADPVATMVVVAHERGRGDRDDWDKYLNMTTEQLSDALEISTDEAEAVVASKSDD